MHVPSSSELESVLIIIVIHSLRSNCSKCRLRLQQQTQHAKQASLAQELHYLRSLQASQVCLGFKFTDELMLKANGFFCARQSIYL